MRSTLALVMALFVLPALAALPPDTRALITEAKWDVIEVCAICCAWCAALWGLLRIKRLFT